VNLIHYYGVLAPAAKWRAAIVPAPIENELGSDACGCEGERDTKRGRRRNYAWSVLMARVFEFDVLKCPDCHGRLKILAAIHPPLNTRKILDCMGLPCRGAPPIAHATDRDISATMGNMPPQRRLARSSR
jgi:hypothetical protein